jgi:hypothetical protein
MMLILFLGVYILQTTYNQLPKNFSFYSLPHS